MKPTSIIIFKIVILYSYAFIFNAQAQTFEEENAKVMGRMDTEGFKGKVVLNKAIALDFVIEPFRNMGKNKEGAYEVHLSPVIAY